MYSSMPLGLRCWQHLQREEGVDASLHGKPNHAPSVSLPSDQGFREHAPIYKLSDSSETATRWLTILSSPLQFLYTALHRHGLVQLNSFVRGLRARLQVGHLGLYSRAHAPSLSLKGPGA